MVVLQVGQQGSQPLQLGCLFPWPRLGGERGTDLPLYCLHPASQLGSTVQEGTPLGDRPLQTTAGQLKKEKAFTHDILTG